MKRSRIIALLIVVVMMLGMLAACGGDDAPEGEETPAPGSDGEYSYVAEFTELTVGDAELRYVERAMMGDDGTIYIMASLVDGMVEEEYTYTDYMTGEEITEVYEYENYVTALMTLDRETKTMERLTNFAMLPFPEGTDGYSSVSGFVAAPGGGFWTIEDMYTYSLEVGDDATAGDGTDDNMGIAVGTSVAAFASTSVAVAPTISYYDYGYGMGEETQKYYLRKFDATGAEIAMVDVTDILMKGDYFYVQGMETDAEGNVYVLNGNTNAIHVFDAQGAHLFDIDGIDGVYVQDLLQLGDGTLRVSMYSETAGGQVLREVDLAAKAYGEETPMPTNAWDVLPAGESEYDYFYANGETMMGAYFGSEEPEALFNWLNINVDSNNLEGVMAMADGTFLAISMNYNGENTEVELINVSQVLTSSLPVYKDITLACMWLDWNVRELILDFNKSNDEYRIIVEDYSQYATDDDYMAGLTKLTTEIVSGDVPDILLAAELPMNQYGAKGLFEDLWPYIEADAEIGGRDALVQPFFEALEQEGKLYQISSYYYVNTIATLKDVTGDIESWTVADALAAFEMLPEGATLMDEYMTKSNLLSVIAYTSLNKFVNWETGEVTFDSPDFIELLKMTEYLPLEYDWEAAYDEMGGYRYEEPYKKLLSGEQLMMSTTLYNLQDTQYMIGPDVAAFAYPGIPTTDGTNGNSFMMGNSLAMSSTSENKEGAWQFMRTLLTEEYQSDNYWDGIPTNMNVYNTIIEEAMEAEYEIDPATGEEVEVPKSYTYDYETEEEIPIYAMTQEQADILWGLTANTKYVSTYDDMLYNIVLEETAAYFDGTATAEDVAAMVQSRASLYVNEQR